jgi:hypothetical protein
MKIKMNLLKRHNYIDGLGYDTKKKQFFTINYIWDYIVDELQDTTYRDVKSGITALSGKDAMAISTRYKSYPQQLLWESRKYIPKYATLEQANEIVKRMDKSFKYTLDTQLGWNKRLLTNDNTIGTEWYRIPLSAGIQTIKEIWEESFNQACFIVLRDSKGFDPDNHEISGSWPENLEIIDQYFVDNNKGRFIAVTGYGKGYLCWIYSYLGKRGKETKIKVYYTNNISNTKQLAHAHVEKYEMGNGNDTKVIVCSSPKKVSTTYGDIDVYSASDGHLKSIIKSAMKYGNEIAFYVNRHSADTFNTLMNKMIEETNYTNEICVTVDEIQEFTGDKSLKTTKAVTNPIKNSFMMGMTATEERRDPSDDRTSVVKNDDVEYFGNIIYEVTALEAIMLGRHTPVDFISLVMGNGCDLTEMVSKNKIIKSKLKTKEPLVRGKLMRSLASTDYVIRKANKKKIVLLTSLIVDADSMMDMLETMKSEEIIPNDYVIISGKNDNKVNGPIDFEKAEKAIFVCTPWSITGLDIPSADCGIATYDFGKNRVARQWIGRTTRVPDGNPDKRALIIIGLDYYDTNPNNLPTLMFVKEDMVNNLNTHSVQAPKQPIQYSGIHGSRVQKPVSHQVVRGQMGPDTEPDLETDWDVIANAIHTNTLGSLDFSRMSSKRVELLIENYDNLQELYKDNERLFGNLEKYAILHGESVYGKFFDYSKLPNTKDGVIKVITTNHKSYNEIEESLMAVYKTKLTQINQNVA